MPNVSVAQIGSISLLVEKIRKLDLDPAVEKKYGEVIKKLEAKVQDLNENSTPVEEFLKLEDVVKKTAEEVVKAQALAQKNKGPTFSWKGKDKATEDEAIAHIKRYLPNSGHGNISQAMNDVTLGRGKATSGASGVLHASAGPEQKGKGCTLFFKRTGDDVEIIAIGQHEQVDKGKKPEYFINWSGSSPFKKDAVYKF